MTKPNVVHQVWQNNARSKVQFNVQQTQNLFSGSYGVPRLGDPKSPCRTLFKVSVLLGFFRGLKGMEPLRTYLQSCVLSPPITARFLGHLRKTSSTKCIQSSKVNTSSLHSPGATTFTIPSGRMDKPEKIWLHYLVTTLIVICKPNIIHQPPNILIRNYRYLVVVGK